MEADGSEDNYPWDFLSKDENCTTKEDTESLATNVMNMCEEVGRVVKVENEDQFETSMINDEAWQDDTNIDDTLSEEFDANRMLKMEMKDEIPDQEESFVPHHGIKIEDIQLENDGSAIIQVKQDTQTEFRMK